MQKNHRTLAALAAILLLAFFLRFYGLGEAHSLQQDEALGAYDAYSLFLTGKDSWGATAPILFREYGMYATQLQPYLALPFIALLGLNETASRLPWALFGALAALAAFIVARELAGGRAGIVAALLAAVSPWLLFSSRLAIQSNIAYPFTALGAALLFTASRKPERLPIAAVFFGLAINLYGNAIAFTSLLLAGYALLYRKELWRNRRHALLALAALAAFALPLAYTHYNTPAASVYSQLIRFDNPNAWGNDAHLQPADALAGNLAAYFSPQFLSSPDILGFTLEYYQYSPNHALPLYLAPLIIAGVVLAVLHARREKKYALLLWWIIAAVLAASLFFPAPNARRFNLAAPAFEVLAATAAIVLLGQAFKHGLFKSNSLKKYAALATLAVLAAWALASTLFFLGYLYGASATDAAASPWYGAGFKQAIQYAEAHPEYDVVFLSINQYSTSYPYAYVLFYAQYPPQQFQMQGGGKELPQNNWVRVTQVGPRYQVCSPTECSIWGECGTAWCENIPANNPLYVLTASERPDLATILNIAEKGHEPLRLAKRP